MMYVNASLKVTMSPRRFNSHLPPPPSFFFLYFFVRIVGAFLFLSEEEKRLMYIITENDIYCNET
ncbi:hypothetical protein Taro_003762 [Colocasia esculenta]|uniref:Uncharacterized protein n=1 Tax=Colocasia esculenta TaxID=4460 RepID=A0A843TPT1_COLES|nr:hypothetical protein [Colocasia esculenta]